MSTAQGKAFVLTVALTPPCTVALLAVINPRYILDVFWRPFVLLCLIPWFFFVKKITIPYLRSPLRHLPQPPGESFWAGHLFTANERPKGDPFRHWLEVVPNSGFIYCRNLFQGFPTLLLTSPEALQDALIGKPYDFEKVGADRKFLSLFIGRGLITTEGAEHKFHRRTVTPAFSGKHINDLVPLFWRKARQFTDVLAEQLDLPQSPSTGETGAQARTGIIELNQWASRVTLDIIGLACVGRDFNTIHNSEDEIAQQYEKILTTDHGNTVALLLFVIGSILIPLNIARKWPFSKRIRETANGRYQLRILCRKLMEVKQRDMETESVKHIDILSVVMRSKQFSDDALVGELLTFLAAGHETTSNALSWTAFLLATHPEIQTKLRSELRTHFARDPIVNSALLDALPYLNAVTSEQLRLYPVVPVTGRQAVCDTSILGQLIPKGTMVIMSPWAINRSKKVWGPTALEFIPERWLGEGSEKLGGSNSPFDFLTFLYGPRSCIGQAFSRAELKCLVAAMVMRFDIQMKDPNEVIQPGGLITVKPKDGLRLRLKELQ